MRFATWRADDVVSAGVVADDGLHPLGRDVSILDLVREGLPAALAVGAEALDSKPVALETVQLLPPLQPPAVRDFAAFEEHVEGASKSMLGAGGVQAEWYEQPVFYFSNPYAMIGAFDEVAPPPGCTVLDYELEVAAVVSRDGNTVSVSDAGDYIFGYTVFNDWSARDLQMQEMKVGLGPAKGKDFATTLGPYLVTADELDPHRTADGLLDLDATVSVNGELIGVDNFRNMSWTFEELLAQASLGAWVRAGDVLGSGTAGNGGCLGELWGRAGERVPPPLQPGDIVEITVAALGTIRNRVVEGRTAPRIRPARRHRWDDNRTQ